MSAEEAYLGREQTQVKHFVLEHYLQRFAHIVGFRYDTVAYVDCFSGPWNSQTDDLSDTSFAIALRELRKAQNTHASQGRSVGIRCLFLEKEAEAFTRLQAFADQQQGVVAQARQAELHNAVPDILKFVRAGGRSTFPFFFIDPTGWTCDMDKIAPLLRHKPGKVLINFMPSHIYRHIRDARPGVRESFRRFFGTDKVFKRLQALYGDDFRGTSPLDVEDELFTCYTSSVREVGNFTYTCPAVVLNPTEDRTHFHLIYATRHPKGVEVFKEVEKRAFEFQNDVRAKADEKKQVREKSSHRSLLARPISRRQLGLRPCESGIYIVRPRPSRSSSRELLRSRSTSCGAVRWDSRWCGKVT